MSLMDDDYRGYPPADRPLVEVLVGDDWLPGELRAWHRRGDEWWANVSWTDGTASTRLDTVPGARVRLVEED